MLLRLGRAQGRTSWSVRSRDGRVFAVFVLPDGTVRVADGLCPHREGPLAEGRVLDGCVACPWHWYKFDLDTGECRTTGKYALTTYPVVEHGGALHAEIGDAPAPTSWSERLRAHARGVVGRD